MLPGTLPVAELTRRLADSQGVGDHEARADVPGVVEALRQAGRLDEARYVERASTGTEVVRPVAEVDPDGGAVLLAWSWCPAGTGGRMRGRAGASTAQRCSDSAELSRSAAARRRPRSRTGPLADPGGRRGPGRGRPRRRLRPVRRPGPDRPGLTSARQRQHRRAGPGPVRPRSGPGRRTGGRGLRRRRRGVRDGRGGVRGGRGPRYAPVRIEVLPGRHRGPGRGRAGRRAARAATTPCCRCRIGSSPGR